MPAQIKIYLVTFGFFLFAIFLGHAVAVEDYDTIVSIILLTLFVLLLIVPGYEFFLALGILSPFMLPLPFVRAFPFIALMLGLCIVKHVFRRSLQKVRAEYVACFTVPILLFFAWVAVRYLFNPVRPNLGASLGSNVTGFRSYFNYGICCLFVITLGFFIQTREQVVKLVKWLGIFSFIFAALLMAVALSGSLVVAQMLSMFGLFVGFFDTGTMRFVVLPGFGCTLLILSCLPNLVRLPTFWRVLLFLLAVIAIFMGGSRGSLASAFAIVLACALVRRRIVFVSTVIFVIICCLIIFRFVGEYYNFKEGVGLMRVLSIVSERVADISDASGTFKWRQMRWERAMADIRERPVFGSGYGGLDNAFTFASRNDYESATIEIDVAAGSIHNGYLAGARAFGIPFCLLFIYIMATGIFSHAIKSARLYRSDPLQSDLHCFIFANMVSQVFSISIGADLNHPLIWFNIALGVLISKMETAKSPARAPEETSAPMGFPVRPKLPEFPLPSLPN